MTTAFVMFPSEDWIEQAARWALANSWACLLPALVALLVSQLRLGLPWLRFVLVALVLAKLVSPQLPWSLWQLPAPGGRSVQVPALQKPSDSQLGGTVQAADFFMARNAPDQEAPVDWKAALPWVWAGGAALLAAWWLVVSVRLSRSIRLRRVVNDAGLIRVLNALARESGCSRKPEVWTLRDWDQVAVHGVLRQRLLIPEDLSRRFSPAEMRGILMHEFAHLRRRDTLWSALGFAAASLQWFNPLAWLLLRRMRAEAELICDQNAMRELPAAERKHYGRALIKVLESFARPAPVLVAPFASHKNEIQHRIRMIAQPNQSRRRKLALTLVLTPLCTIALLGAAERESDGGRSSREGERERERVTREGDAERVREGVRDGDGRAKEGSRDGELRKTGPRDGDRPREGERVRDGEGRGSKEGARDGDRPREGERVRDGEGRGKEGARDGDRPREGERMRDGDGRGSKEGARDGERSREGVREGEGRSRGAEGRLPSVQSSRSAAAAGSQAMVISLDAQGNVVTSDGRTVALSDVREKLSKIVAGNPGQVFTLRADAASPLDRVMEVMQVAKEAGVKNISLGK